MFSLPPTDQSGVSRLSFTCEHSINLNASDIITDDFPLRFVPYLLAAPQEERRLRAPETSSEAPRRDKTAERRSHLSPQTNAVPAHVLHSSVSPCGGSLDEGDGDDDAGACHEDPTPLGQTEPEGRKGNVNTCPLSGEAFLSGSASTCRLRASASSSSICSERTVASSSSLMMICSTAAAGETTETSLRVCLTTRADEFPHKQVSVHRNTRQLPPDSSGKTSIFTSKR